MPRPDDTSPSALNRNEIISHPGGVSFIGEGAVGVYRAQVLCSAIALLKVGISPARGVTMKLCLAEMGKLTGKKYRRADADKAVRDVKQWIDIKSTPMLRSPS